MNLFRSAGTALFFVLSVMTTANYATAEICNRVVAVVNDDVITLHELNNKIKELTGQTPFDLKMKSEPQFMETRRRVLDLLIDTKISEEKIREMGIQVSEKQVDETIEKIKQDNHWTHEDLSYRLKSEGISYEQYREKIKKDLERIRLINFEVKSKIIIREEMIGQYYESHRDEFSSNRSVHLATIFLARKDPRDPKELRELTEKGERILAEIRAGKDFGELVRQYSDGPGADEGGDLGEFKTVQLEPELRKILEPIPEGGASDLIIRPQGVQIIKLLKKTKGEMKSLDQVRDAIYGRLYQEEVDKRYSAWIKELRERSYTKIVF